MSDSLRPHGLQHARFICPPLSPRVCSNAYPLNQWCYLNILSSFAPHPTPVSRLLLPPQFPSSPSRVLRLSTSRKLCPRRGALKGYSALFLRWLTPGHLAWPLYCHIPLGGGLQAALGWWMLHPPPPPPGHCSHQCGVCRGLSLTRFIYFGPWTMKPGSEGRMERPFPIFPPGLSTPLRCPLVPGRREQRSMVWKQWL